MKQVNIIVGRFQPITKGHIKCIETIWNKLHIPTIIVMIETKKLDERHPFDSSVLLEVYKKMFASNEMIEDIITFKNADIVKIGGMLRESGYEIRSWVCGTDRYESYLNMSTKYAEQAFLPDDFEVIEIKRGDDDISATKLRTAIKNNDFETFVKLFPKTSTPIKIYSKLKEMYDRSLG